MLDFPERTPETSDVLSVSALNRRVSGVLEQEFPLLWVQGEVSNFVSAASGHWYFSLKDAAAQVRVVMFRQRAALSGFTPKNGDQIQVRCRVSFYEPRGEFQLGAEAIRRAGAGDLFAQFERLKRLLQAEGLFDSQRKRAIPTMVRRIAVVTSPKGAALRDVLSTLSSRAPGVEVIVVPALVQGAEAPKSLLQALQAASQLPIDLLLLVRGGGAIEDLWAFNDERLARIIALFPVPVICGVGHETDFTIADFVADLRAATPTAAAVLAVTDQSVLKQHLVQLAAGLVKAHSRVISNLWQRLDMSTRLLRSPQERLAQQQLRLDTLKLRVATAFGSVLRAQKRRFDISHERLSPVSTAVGRVQVEDLLRRLRLSQGNEQAARQSKLNHLEQGMRLVNPSAVLDRGFALVTDEQGRVLTQATKGLKGSSIRVRLRQGALIAQVEQTVIDDHLL